MKIEIDNAFAQDLNKYHFKLLHYFKEANKICRPDEYNFRIQELLLFTSEALIFLLNKIGKEIEIENSNDKGEKMDKQIRKIKKNVKKEEKDLTHLEHADKKRDKLVTAGKKAMKGKC